MGDTYAAEVLKLARMVDATDEFRAYMGEFGPRGWALVEGSSPEKTEKLGMKMSGGRKVSTHLRKLMGLKRTVPIELLQEWVNTALVHVGYEIGGEK
jgi:hypothetical protein